MKTVYVVAVLGIACSSPSIAADADRDAAKSVIAAVKRNADLIAAFPGAISAPHAASLKRVAKCSAVNLMKQKAGYYTVVWDCRSKGALEMKIMVEAGRVTAISTMEIGMEPNSR